MLCLGRKVNERIICESAETGKRLLEIVVLRASDGKTRLGLVGDRHVRIVRAELVETDEPDSETGNSANTAIVDIRPTAAEAACEVDDETAAENTIPPLSMPVPAWYADLPSIGGQ